MIGAAREMNGPMGRPVLIVGRLRGRHRPLELWRCEGSLSACPFRPSTDARDAPSSVEGRARGKASTGSGEITRRCLEVRTPEQALNLLRSCVAGAEDMQVLRRIVGDDDPVMIARLDTEQVLARVAAKLAQHALCLTERAAPPAVTVAPAPEAPRPPRASGRRVSPQSLPSVRPAPELPKPGSAVGPPAQELPSPPLPLSFYELTVLDELETGIAGVEVELTTPKGTETLITDGSGRVRVDEAPPGTASARILSAQQLFVVLENRVDQDKRRTPLPTADDLVVLTSARAGTSVSFPDARPQRIMIVSRTDVLWSSVVPRWGDLQLLVPETEPCRLLADGVVSILKLCSTGAGPRALIGLPPSGVDVEPTSPGAAADMTAFVDSKARLAIDIDALHEALFASDFDTVSALIDSAAEEPPPPPPPPDFPAPSQEGVEFGAALALLALQGVVDAPFVPEKQV